MYIVSNQKNKKNNLKEVFSNMHKRNSLPNVDKPVKNYPVLDRNELEDNVWITLVKETLLITTIILVIGSFTIVK